MKYFFVIYKNAITFFVVIYKNAMTFFVVIYKNSMKYICCYLQELNETFLVISGDGQ